MRCWTPWEHRTVPGVGAVTPDTRIGPQLDAYLERVATDGGHTPRTVATYRDAVKILRPRVADLRVRELTPGLVNDVLRGIRADHGDTRARQAKVALRAVMLEAVLAGAAPVNPVDQITARSPKRGRAKDAPPADAADLPRLLKRLRTSARCRRWDLVDPVILASATGLRAGELLALRWQDVDLEAATVTVVGRIYRVPGKGLVWDEGTKGGDDRPLPLPRYAVDQLRARLEREGVGPNGWLFANGVGKLRDPDNYRARWRDARQFLGPGMDAITGHSFRKMVATVVDDAGLSARVAAEQLGHAKPSMTQDVYMRRGTAHRPVADALDQVAGTRISEG